MRSLDEEIAKHLQDAAAAGELTSAPSYGKPLAGDAGWDDTPEALRMPFKILKDAGVFPPEIEMFHERARLRQAIAEQPDGAQREHLSARLSELEQRIALRLEALQANARS